jgi:hypothetical protein
MKLTLARPGASSLKLLILQVSLCAAFGITGAAASADPITVVSLSNSAPNMEFKHNGSSYEFLTIDDGQAGTTGDQNASVDFQDFLDPLLTDIPSAASFSMSGLVTSSATQIFGPTGPLLQLFSGGTFSLFGPANSLLLSGTLGTSGISGNLLPTGNGSLFLSNVASITGGAMQPYLVSGTLTISMNATSIDGSNGFSLAPITNLLNPFTMNATVKFSAGWTGIPEPSSAVLALVGSAFAAMVVRRRRRV